MESKSVFQELVVDYRGFYVFATLHAEGCFSRLFSLFNISGSGGAVLVFTDFPFGREAHSNTGRVKNQMKKIRVKNQLEKRRCMW